jgi:hypothetical protein
VCEAKYEEVSQQHKFTQWPENGEVVGSEEIIDKWQFMVTGRCGPYSGNQIIMKPEVVPRSVWQLS